MASTPTFANSEPSGGRYAHFERVKRGGTVKIQELDDVVLDVSELIGE